MPSSYNTRMSVKVRIPSAFRNITNDKADVTADGTNVKTAIKDIDRQYPGIFSKIYDNADKQRRFIAIFVNDVDIRSLNGDLTPLENGDEVIIVSAIAGG